MLPLLLRARRAIRFEGITRWRSACAAPRRAFTPVCLLFIDFPLIFLFRLIIMLRYAAR